MQDYVEKLYGRNDAIYFLARFLPVARLVSPGETTSER